MMYASLDLWLCSSHITLCQRAKRKFSPSLHRSASVAFFRWGVPFLWYPFPLFNFRMLCIFGISSYFDRMVLVGDLICFYEIFGVFTHDFFFREFSCSLRIVWVFMFFWCFLVFLVKACDFVWFESDLVDFVRNFWNFVLISFQPK